MTGQTIVVDGGQICRKRRRRWSRWALKPEATPVAQRSLSTTSSVSTKKSTLSRAKQSGGRTFSTLP